MSPEINFMTNLQNMKHGLKRDYSDPELMDLLFKNLSFTDQLIKDHIGDGGQSKEEPSLVTRDPACYREFVKQTYFSKDQEDPFSHFYIKESGKIERVYRVHDTEMNKYKDFIKGNEDKDIVEKTEKNILKTL